MIEIVYATTGKVEHGDKNTVLNSGAIGSCVVVTMYNSLEKTGAMAHILLPGDAPSKKESSTTKYASNAIQRLMELMNKNNDKINTLETCIIGGANVLKRPNDNTGENNINSVEKLLGKRGIKICASSVGGFERRTAVLDIEKGCVYFTIGDSKMDLLWQTGHKAS